MKFLHRRDRERLIEKGRERRSLSTRDKNLPYSLGSPRISPGDPVLLPPATPQNWNGSNTKNRRARTNFSKKSNQTVSRKNNASASRFLNTFPISPPREIGGETKTGATTSVNFPDCHLSKSTASSLIPCAASTRASPTK
jgi:hypothetical protein